MRAALIPILFTRRLTGGLALLGGAGTGFPAEPQGLGIDFTTVDGLASVAVKDTTTAGNNLSNVPADSFLTQSGTSPKLVLWSDGLYRWSPHNLFVNSTSSPATQNVTLITGATYTYGITGSGSLAGSSGASGSATTGSPITFVATGVTGTFTITGSVTTMWINRGSVSLAYHATGAAAWFGVPIEYDPVTAKFYGLVEPAATNLALQSRALGTSPWGTSGTANTVTPNTNAAPDGGLTADTVSFGASGSSYRYQDFVGTVAVHTASVLARVASGTGTFRIKTAWLQGSDETATTTWQRFSLTFTASAITGDIGVSNGSDGVARDIIFSDFQVELGPAATSPVPSFAATVTRSADNINAALSTFPYGSGGLNTAVVRFSPFGNGKSQAARSYLLAIDSGGGNNRWAIYSGDTSTVNAPQMNTGDGVGVTQAAPSATQTANAWNKVAAAADIANSGPDISLNGAAQTAAGGRAWVPSSPTTIYFGGASSGAVGVPMRLASVVIVPRTMTASQMAAASTP